jgi:hypothetical protein
MDINHNEAWEGFGSASMEDVQSLLKALSAQEGITDVANLKGLGALQPQSLESTLVMLTASDKHLTLWKDIPKGAAKSTLEEYSVMFGHGQDSSGWVQQMENPIESDPQYARDFAKMKFQRQMWKFSSVAGMVETITPAEAASKQAASMRCLRNMNRALYSGDSEFAAESIDGFEKVIKGNGSVDHVVDLRGIAPTQADFRQAAELITANFGVVDGCGLYLSPGAQSTLDTIMEPAQRFLQGSLDNNGGLSVGYGTKKIHTSFGTIVPKVDIFLAGEYDSRGVPMTPDPSNPRTLIEGKTSVNAPTAPTIAVAAATGVSGSKFSATGVRPSGVIYNYRVAAGNRFGLSNACASGAAGGAVAAGGANNITITKAGGDAYPSTYYEIYSELVAGNGKFYLIGRIKDSGSPTTVFADRNLTIPGTSKMFLLDLTSIGDMRTFMLKRLAPMHALEYAAIGPYRWGTINLYATPLYYAPLRFVMFENVPIGVQSANKYLSI